MARDEAEQKHAEDGLREAQQELERVSRQTTLGAMTASIAHEINQPLSAIVAHGNAGLRWLARKDPNLYVVEIAGITKSEYSVFVKALTASLELKQESAQFGQVARR